MCNRYNATFTLYTKGASDLLKMCNRNNATVTLYTEGASDLKNILYICSMLILQALEKFFKSVYSLYSAPRIVEPVWLSMITSSPRRTCLCSRFFNDLMFFVERYDTKSTNLLVSFYLIY